MVTAKVEVMQQTRITVQVKVVRTNVTEKVQTRIPVWIRANADLGHLGQNVESPSVGPVGQVENDPRVMPDSLGLGFGSDSGRELLPV